MDYRRRVAALHEPSARQRLGLGLELGLHAMRRARRDHAALVQSSYGYDLVIKRPLYGRRVVKVWSWCGHDVVRRQIRRRSRRQSGGNQAVTSSGGSPSRRNGEAARLRRVRVRVKVRVRDMVRARIRVRVRVGVGVRVSMGDAGDQLRCSADYRVMTA